MRGSAFNRDLPVQSSAAGRWRRAPCFEAAASRSWLTWPIPGDEEAACLPACMRCLLFRVLPRRAWRAAVINCALYANSPPLPAWPERACSQQPRYGAGGAQARPRGRREQIKQSVGTGPLSRPRVHARPCRLALTRPKPSFLSIGRDFSSRCEKTKKTSVGTVQKKRGKKTKKQQRNMCRI